MATYNVSRSCLDKTLSGTTQDVINFDADDAGGAERFLVVYNEGSTKMYGRTDGIDAEASADGTTPILPGWFETFEVGQFGDKQIKVVGNGNLYSVVGTNFA